jgi:hypothetical protein
MRRLPVVMFAAAVAVAPSLAAAAPLEELLASARHAVAGLGVYRATITKTERVHGKLVGPETAEVWIRETPRAVRMTFLAGGRPGRRLLYNETVRARQMLVREPGVLGFMSVWVDIDGWLVRRSTSHTVREVGFGALLDLIDRDVARARPFGGHRRVEEPPGGGPGGTSCETFLAPPGATDVYATRTRLCFDRALALPMVVEVFDHSGFLERFEWRQVEPHQTVDDRFFTAQGAGW